VVLLVEDVVLRELGVCCCCGEFDVLGANGLCVWCVVCCTGLMFVWHGHLDTVRVLHHDW
jgi:hypothetical protein